MTTTIIVAIVAVVVALLIAVPVTCKVAVNNKIQKDAEIVGTAEDKARSIIDEALKTAAVSYTHLDIWTERYLTKFRFPEAKKQKMSQKFCQHRLLHLKKQLLFRKMEAIFCPVNFWVIFHLKK